MVSRPGSRPYGAQPFAANSTTHMASYRDHRDMPADTNYASNSHWMEAPARKPGSGKRKWVVRIQTAAIQRHRPFIFGPLIDCSHCWSCFSYCHCCGSGCCDLQETLDCLRLVLRIFVCGYTNRPQRSEYFRKKLGIPSIVLRSGIYSRGLAAS